MIELYIENKKIDITDDLEINFTYESIDPDKLSSIKNSFSKTVNIPGTASNNITFGHIFRYDKYIPVAGPTKIDSYYDPHKKVNWFINKNGAVINRGYCTLDNILMKNERDITYQLTLYGGIGEFFYSLTYNEDGSPKTLYDMYWDWYPKTNLLGHGAHLDPGQENTLTLFKCSADIIASVYHNLDPLYSYSGSTAIDQDVVFVPCYTGLYEDFDSKHMLVSTFNQNYNSIPAYLSSDKVSALQASFPDTYTDDEGTYTTIDKNFSASGAYKYGLVTFSRDIDPFEAGDLRVNELPVAIRLSKLMTVISNPMNNGGYEVEWDDEIKQSYHWLYSWILLGKIKQDKEELNMVKISANTTYDGQQNIINVNWETGSTSQTQSTQSYDLNLSGSSLSKGNYLFTLNVLPNCFISADTGGGHDFNYYLKRYPYTSSSFHSNVITPGHGQQPYEIYRVINTVSALVHKFYDGTTFIKAIADIFFYTSDLNYTFPSKSNYTELDAIRTTLQNEFCQNGETIAEIKVHNCLLQSPESMYDETHWYTEYWWNYNCENEKISTNISFSNDVSTLNISQFQCVMWTDRTNINPNAQCGIYGIDNISLNCSGPSSASSPEYQNISECTFGFIVANNLTRWPYPITPEYFVNKFGFKLNEDLQNGFSISKTSGFNILNLDKKTLFANSESPMKYLSGYCKLMNYKFICDETEKKIQIKPLKQYYLNRIINLDERVDLGRDINIKNVTSKYKTLNIGLESTDTYPIYLFNKISREKFNIERYDTGIEYNATESSLLNDLIFKNTLEWQQSSIFYNIYPQFPRAYDTQSISWTLFDTTSANVDEIKKKEIFTVGTPSTNISLLANVDFLPKIALFDKDNKAVDFSSSLIFLNGFVKNYDYSEISTTTKRELTPDSTNPSHYINTSGVVTSSQYQDIYIYNVLPNTTYYVSATNNSSYSSYVANYYNSSGTRIGTEYTQKNANLVDAVLTLPPGTTQIRCNFRKADTTAVLKAVGPYFVISPKVSLSNDMYEQYYLNQARCYMYDFKYNDNFTSWGCYSSDQKGSASSWLLPMFTRDLYNSFDSTNGWTPSSYKLASWNLTNQEGLDTWYKLINTVFVSDKDITLSKNTYIDNWSSNEYTINEVPQDSSSTDRIFEQNWKEYLKDLYDRNARDVTAYVDLSGLGDAKSIMRYIYSWKSHLWVITKLYNFKIAETVHDKFTKVTMHKIRNLNNWVN